MRLFLLTSVTMLAFAANSILTRLAVSSSAIDPGSFAVIRVLSGAVMLTLLVVLSGRRLRGGARRRLVGGGSLAVYMVGFSLAYLSLDAGLGALILFGVVQTTMFVLSALRGAAATARQLAGAAIAFAGLALVLWPSGAQATDLTGAAFMIAAGVGWAVYTLAGRDERDPLIGTAANFWVAVPLVALTPLLATEALQVSATGALLAMLSGAVTSGLGYALWYRVLPHLAPSVAATVQLSVPVIALAAGVVLLGETATVTLGIGALAVLGGIALASGRKPALRAA